jgi:prepilin-type N-terminal cleavage/methylation domain-containing protein
MRGAVVRARASTDDGFTLAELMFVMVILAILVGIAVASYHLSTVRATTAVCRANQHTLQTCVSSYQIDYDSLPTTITDLGEYVHAPGDWRTCPADPSVEYEIDAAGRIVCSVHP